MKIGVVGAAGDLGGQLCVQAVSMGMQTYGYVRRNQRIATITGVDLVTKVRTVNTRVIWAQDVVEVMRECAIVHWCAPLSALEDIADLPTNCVLVLHDSVMSRSVAAREALLARFPGSRIAIVHFLMNTDATVVLAEGYDEHLDEHIRKLGLHPKYLSVAQHDTLMAHSQAPLAILCKLLLDDLNAHHADGLLTNSGQALRKALIDRSAQWTEATYAAILDNPELPSLVAAIQRLINNYKV